MNPAFKHLDAKLRIAELTIRQWVSMFVGVLVAFLYADLIHPFGTLVTTISAVYFAGIPVAAILVAGSSDFDAWLVLRSALRWRSSDDRYLPGAGLATDGYRVRSLADDVWHAEREQLAELDPADLWGGR
jgi:hypothetical protein